jgi:membrane fusion protein (multidrug efflux system)
VAAGLVAALAAPGCGSEGPDAQGSARGDKPVTVEVAAVEAKLLRDVATFSGQLDAEFSVVIKSEIEGRIESIEFEEGQNVAQGDLLVRLQNDTQKAVLREAIANRSLAQAEYDRTQQLVTRDAASAAKKDRVAAELEVAKARVDRARAELARTELRAPFDGVVGFRRVDVGDSISEEDPIVRLDAIDRLQLTFSTSDHAVAFAHKGMHIEARVAPYPGEVFPGEVFVISPTLDPQTRRVILKAWVANEDHRLRPGMFADLDLEVGRRESAIAVPESAVVFDHHGTFVWRVNDEDVAERVPIETGLRTSGIVEVTMGLHSGDVVVVAGTHKVSEGDKVAAATTLPTGQALRPPKAGAEGGEGT